MNMNGSQRIEAPQNKVWAALNDPEILKQSIPGCESIEKLSDTQMKATVTFKVGPVKASFAGNVTLSDIDPPNGYTISGEGSGGAAGFAKGSAKVQLQPDGQSTILNYTVNAEMAGKIAQLGSRLIDSAANKLANEFFERFSQVVAPHAQSGKPDRSKQKTSLLRSIFARLRSWLRFSTAS